MIDLPPKVRQGERLKASTINALIDAVRRSRVLPSSTVRVSQSANGTRLEALVRSAANRKKEESKHPFKLRVYKDGLSSFGCVYIPNGSCNVNGKDAALANSGLAIDAVLSMITAEEFAAIQADLKDWYEIPMSLRIYCHVHNVRVVSTETNAEISTDSEYIVNEKENHYDKLPDSVNTQNNTKTIHTYWDFVVGGFSAVEVNENTEYIVESQILTTALILNSGSMGENGGYYKPSVDASGNLTWEASKQGMPSVSGINIKGKDGTTGGYYTPHLDANGNLSWTGSQSGMASVGSSNIRGPVGPTGPSGGPKGATGSTGGYYTPSVDGNGNLSWTASKEGMPSVGSVNIKGVKGDTGNVGPTGASGSLTDADRAFLNGATGAATDAAQRAAQSASGAAQSAQSAEQAKIGAINAEGAAGRAAESAAQSARKAAQSEAKAAQSEANAAQSENNAAQSETNAAQSETNAAQSETKAAQSEAKAAQSEANAAQSEIKAAQSETNAAQSENHADTLAGNALKSAELAVTAAGTAGRSATAAEQAEANVRQLLAQAQQAKAAAETAKGQAETAKQQAESAKSAAETAKGQAESAKQQASADKESAESAKQGAEAAKLAAEQAQQNAEDAVGAEHGIKVDYVTEDELEKFNTEKWQFAIYKETFQGQFVKFLSYEEVRDYCREGKYDELGNKGTIGRAYWDSDEYHWVFQPASTNVMLSEWLAGFYRSQINLLTCGDMRTDSSVTGNKNDKSVTNDAMGNTALFAQELMNWYFRVYIRSSSTVLSWLGLDGWFYNQGCWYVKFPLLKQLMEGDHLVDAGVSTTAPTSFVPYRCSNGHFVRTGGNLSFSYKALLEMFGYPTPAYGFMYGADNTVDHAGPSVCVDADGNIFPCGYEGWVYSGITGDDKKRIQPMPSNFIPCLSYWDENKRVGGVKKAQKVRNPRENLIKRFGF